MSVYKGTLIEQAYAQGHDRGYRYGENDLGMRGSNITYYLELFRKEAAWANESAQLGPAHRHEAALRLGIVRGYREAVR